MLDETGGGVQSSTDYSKFGYFNANRDVNEKHVNELKESMTQFPDLFKLRPILVNDQFKIVDGQHRFEAAVQKGDPIYFVVGDNLTVEDALHINVNQKNWGPFDFAKHYATQGNKHYQEFLKLHESYPQFGSGTLRMLLNPISGNRQTHGGEGMDSENAGSFRKGFFEVGDVEQAYKWAEMLLELHEIHPTGVKSGAIRNALIRIFQNPDYNHKQMVGKIAKYGYIWLDKSRGNMTDYIRDLEETYNYHQPEGTRTRFF